MTGLGSDNRILRTVHTLHRWEAKPFDWISSRTSFRNARADIAGGFQPVPPEEEGWAHIPIGYGRLTGRPKTRYIVASATPNSGRRVGCGRHDDATHRSPIPRSSRRAPSLRKKAWQGLGLGDDSKPVTLAALDRWNGRSNLLPSGSFGGEVEELASLLPAPPTVVDPAYTSSLTMAHWRFHSPFP